MVTEKRGRIAAFLRGQQVRYLLVAGTTSVFYLALVAGGLALSLHYLVAILIAQSITIVSAFPFYRTFVFESRSSVWLDFVRFLTVWLSGMVAGLVATPLLVELLGWHPLLAQIVAIVVVSVLSYLSHRYFSFRAARSPHAEGTSHDVP